MSLRGIRTGSSNRSQNSNFRIEQMLGRHRRRGCHERRPIRLPGQRRYAPNSRRRATEDRRGENILRGLRSHAEASAAPADQRLDALTHPPGRTEVAPANTV